MHKLIGIFFTGLAFLALWISVVPKSVWSAPAIPFQFEGCFVQDANMTYYPDPDCDVHYVLKFDRMGDTAGLMTYQDHGHLPPEAVFPDEAVQFIVHVDCQCLFDGDYQVTLTPAGEYHSFGPLNRP